MMARPSQPKQLKIRLASVPFDDESAAIAGRLRKEWESLSKEIGPQDTPITAIVLQHE